MTKATRDITKLNFITDQGSTRATVRCACRTGRCADFFRDVLRAGSAAWPAVAAASPAVAADAEGVAVVLPLERRKLAVLDLGQLVELPLALQVGHLRFQPVYLGLDLRRPLHGGLLGAQRLSASS